MPPGRAWYLALLMLTCLLDRVLCQDEKAGLEWSAALDLKRQVCSMSSARGACVSSTASSVATASCLCLFRASGRADVPSTRQILEELEHHVFPGPGDNPDFGTAFVPLSRALLRPLIFSPPCLSVRHHSFTIPHRRQHHLCCAVPIYTPQHPLLTTRVSLTLCIRLPGQVPPEVIPELNRVRRVRHSLTPPADTYAHARFRAARA